MSLSDVAEKLILDNTKIQWHLDRVRAWERGERIAPILVDMAMTTGCNLKCYYCFAYTQYNKPMKISQVIMRNFLDDCVEIGVKAVSLISDGESTVHPWWVEAIEHGTRGGLDMAIGTHGGNFTPEDIDRILPLLTYIRINLSATTPESYKRIHGVSGDMFGRVIENVKYAVKRKSEFSHKCTIGLQGVFDSRDADQIVSLAKLGVELGVDYVVLKHMSDSEDKQLGVNYSKYESLYPAFREGEALGNSKTAVVAKWNKITVGNKRSYQRCYGPPFFLQISGTGLLAPCGHLFREKFKDDFHIGNICETRFKDIWKSE